MKLSAMIVFYHPKEENIQNIEHILSSVDQLYLVDNSDDDVIRYQSNAKVQYIKFHENKGIARALNEGAKRAIQDGYSWLLTLDQDSSITHEIIAKMKSYLLKHQEMKIGLVSPYHDIDADEEIKDVEAEEMIEVMTSGNIINLDAYQEIGGFKDWMFIDAVDTEYCMNLNQHGYKVLRLNRIWMKHPLGNLKVHTLFGKEYPCYNHSPIRRYYMVRNALYLKDMYGKEYPQYCQHLIQVQKGQVKRILAFEKDKIKKLKMMYRGYQDYKHQIKGKYAGK